MAVKIRLKRLGKIRVPQYRIVVVDSRKKRDGKVIEEIGKYHPKEDPSYIAVVADRAQYWLGVGAQPTEAVEQILKITGDWQKFKGLPGTEGTLKVKEPKRDKLEIFNEALKDAASEPKAGATTTRKKAEKKAPRLPLPRLPLRKHLLPRLPPRRHLLPRLPPRRHLLPRLPAEDAPAPVPADETPEGAAEAAEAAETETNDKSDDPERDDARRGAGAPGPRRGRQSRRRHRP